MSHRRWEGRLTCGIGHGGVTLDTSSPLQLACSAVGDGDEIPHHGANVRGGLGQDAGAVAEVGVLVGFDGVVPSFVEVVEDHVGVGDDSVGLYFRSVKRD